MVAVVLPDSNGSYSYYLESRTCCSSYCTTHHTDKLFTILAKNKFNLEDPSTRECTNNEGKIWTSPNPSYIGAVKWDAFIADYKKYIDAVRIILMIIQSEKKYKFVVGLSWWRYTKG